MTAWFFGDSFDTYNHVSDLIAGTYWDAWDIYHEPNLSFVSGRFSNGKAIQTFTGYWYKTSGSNDSIHHISMSVYIPEDQQFLFGTRQTFGFKLYDDSNIQCSLFFDESGNIQISSGDNTGSPIATYLYAIGYTKTWYNFEIEIVIHNTDGSIIIRKNGNTVPDFTVTGINTRAGSSNNYANKIWLGVNPAYGFCLDDFLWRSDPTIVPWVGDIRCYVRRPSSDVSVTWTPSSSSIIVQPVLGGVGSLSTGLGTPPLVRYLSFTSPYDGVLDSIALSISTSSTGTISSVIYASSNNSPTGSPIATATPVTNPSSGLCTFNFPTPLNVSRETAYWFAFQSTSNSISAFQIDSSSHDKAIYTYLETNDWSHSFPITDPTSLYPGTPFWIQATITPTSGANAPMVCDMTVDGTLSYVSTTSVGAYDFYHVSNISSVPSNIIGVVTRGFISKSDSGSRVATIQLKSGSTVVQASYPSLTVNWGWVWRADQVDPNTGSAWTASAVNNSQIGPILIS